MSSTIFDEVTFDHAMQMIMDAGFSPSDDSDIASASVGRDVSWVESYLGWRVEADYTITVVDTDTTWTPATRSSQALPTTWLIVRSFNSAGMLGSKATFEMTPRGLRWFDAAISATISQG